MGSLFRHTKFQAIMLAVAACVGIGGLLVGQGRANADGAAAEIDSARLLTASLTISGTYPNPVVPGWPGGYPFPCPPWPTPAPQPGMPTPPPMPTPTPGPATGLSYRVCPQIVNRVPAAVQQQALASPWTVYGYGMRLNRGVPEHPLWNPYRTWLTLLDYGKPWDPCNPVVWKAGCP